MRKTLLLSLTMAMLLPSCSLTGRGIEPKSIGETIQQKPIIIDTACKWVRPIYISKKDQLTDGTARQILSHNKTVAVNCPENSTTLIKN